MAIKTPRRKPRPASKATTPVFPCGAEYDAIPAGARETKVLWKRPAGPMRLPGGGLIECREETTPCDLELAIETEANMRLVAILRAGKLPSEEDLERCATKPPMSGRRLGDLLQRIGEGWEQYARRAVLARPRVMGSKGGKAKREDRHAADKDAVLKAWRNRTNRLEGALPWAERMYGSRAIKVKPRTAASWIRAQYPKKKRKSRP